MKDYANAERREALAVLAAHDATGRDGPMGHTLAVVGLLLLAILSFCIMGVVTWPS